MKLSLRNQFTLDKMNRNTIDEAGFQAACDTMLAMEKASGGIGTLSEKGVHAVLKYYYVPDTDHHEIRIGDKGTNKGYVADAVLDGEIYEIQSRSFHLLKGKLDDFLKEHDVTVVYPIAVTKYLRYVDPETGEISPSKKSSQKKTIYDIVPELYRIKNYLSNSKLHFILCFIEMEEYKTQGKTSRKTSKIDRFPTRILGEFRIDCKKDYLNLLPGFENGKKRKDCPLPTEFTTLDIARLSGHNISYAQALTNVLASIKLIKNTGKNGRYQTYKLAPARNTNKKERL